ncbi:PTS IIA-like nitrogen regulatory protein PtsN [Xanthobacter sp. TB0136]|uniref:PTS IIA-like nitrogen regulatory protein PtsN n=1 Tax=Xanthobacter sp. TB0136 TaxID=3459177 RepID=UPI004039931E
MPLADILVPNAVFPMLRASSKKQLLQELAQHAAALMGRDSREIFETLLQRERLGSTGVGNGIAIPHGKLPDINRLFGMFARLDTPIDYDALDGEPVDLVFLLLAPEAAGADHLKALARVARLMRDPEMVEKLRATHDSALMYRLLTTTAEASVA